ncbi:MAG: LuxR C-terminal-related transcriptional regulator [Treponema sp.]
MRGLDVIVQTGISIMFLLQYHGIVLLYGRLRLPVLRAYKRLLLCFMAVTGARAAHLLVSGWFFNLHITEFSRLFTLYENERHIAAHSFTTVLYIAIHTLLDLLNPGWLLIFFPPLILALIRLERIPISRLQKRLKNVTVIAGGVCTAFYTIFPLLQTLSSLGFLAEGTFPARTLTFFYRFVSIIFFTMYALFVAWAVHACKVRVLTPFPFMQKVFYRVIRIAGVICAWIFISSIPVIPRAFGFSAGFLAILPQSSVPFPFYEDLMLYGLFAFSGLYVLHCEAREGFRTNSVKEQSAAPAVDAADSPNSSPFIMEESEDKKQHYRSFFLDCGLTEREAEVAVLIALAKSNKEIAIELNIAYNTVKNHVANVYKKTGTHNRFELARFGSSSI